MPSADVNNPATATTVYGQRFGPLRTQVGPLSSSNPFLTGTDILGIPTMQGKVVVMDPKPLDTLLDVMRTYVYDPGTPFRPGTAESDPGCDRRRCRIHPVQSCLVVRLRRNIGRSK
jgi:hypothetical protein